MKVKLTLAIVGGLALTALASRADLNFAGINNVQFNPSGTSFQLNPIAGSISTPQFDFVGADTGLTGWITGAPWTVNMASLSSITLGGLTYEQASVIGGGQLNIFDGSTTLTGNVTLGQIHTLSNGQGGLSDSMSINLTDLAYTGSNSDLLALLAGRNGNLNFTFQFSGTDPNLSSIFSPNAGVTVASYSGSISSIVSPVPEPTSLAYAVLTILPFGIAKMRSLRR